MKFKTILRITFFLLLYVQFQAQTLTNIQVLEGNKNSLLNTENFLTIHQAPLSLFLDCPPNCTTTANEIRNWLNVSEYVKKNAKNILELIEVQKKFPLIYLYDKKSEDIAIQSTAYSIMAQASENQLNDYFSKNSISGVSEQLIRHEISNIRMELEKSVLPLVTISATGNIRNIASEPDKQEPVAAGTGTLGASFSIKKDIYSVQFNVASTLDTVKNNFGNGILSPTKGKFFQSGSIEWYHNCHDNYWLHYNVYLASQTWEIEKAIIYKNATVFGVGAHFCDRLINGKIAETDIGLDLEAGIGVRFIGGNVRNMLSNPTDSIKYVNVLPSTKSCFVGIESGFTLNFGQIVGALQASYYLKGKQSWVDDLTGLQLSVGISVRGDLLKATVGGN
ncbi:MAG: hypothetical protein WBB31_13295 [Saprospiraceae bacterium]